MSSNVLVAYVTKYGSTQEVAEEIGLRLRERGLEVDIQPMKKVRTIAQYQAIVLGAPIYMFHLVKDAMRFLSHFKIILIEKPTAFFTLGPFNDVEKEWNEVREQFDKELAQFPWFKPVATEVFGGTFDPTKLRFPLNILPGLKQIPRSDLRDWTKIRNWANELAAILQIKPH
jgi:menaquinone-dependent protoporphyrinogen oxidase